MATVGKRFTFPDAASYEYTITLSDNEARLLSALCDSWFWDSFKSDEGIKLQELMVKLANDLPAYEYLVSKDIFNDAEPVRSKYNLLP